MTRSELVVRVMNVNGTYLRPASICVGASILLRAGEEKEDSSARMMVENLRPLVDMISF